MKYLVGLLIVIIIALAGGLAYFIGKNSNEAATTQEVVSPTPTTNQTEDTLVTPTPIAEKTKIITGGGILSFPKYEITLPADWTFERESENADSEKITLAGDGFTITILQGGFGGAVCLFPGDPDLEGPSSRYDYFEDITTKSNDQFRRVWSTGSFTGYGLCQLTQYGWGVPTSYGHISIKANAVPNNQQVTVLDNVLASFTKK